jgi:hypothetical protein
LPKALPFGDLAKNFPGIYVDQETNELVWENRRVASEPVPAPRTVSEVVADRIRNLLTMTDKLPQTSRALRAITELNETDSTLYEPEAVNYRVYRREIQDANSEFLEQVLEVLNDTRA